MLRINLISLYLLSAAVAVVYWAVRIRMLNGSGYTVAALLLCLAVCFYILGYTMELNAATPSQIIFWNRIEYIGIPFVSALWLTTGLMYTGRFARHRAAWSAAIFAIPFATMILRLTNEYHHLYIASAEFVRELGGLIFVRQFGPWAYVQMVHSALMILAAMGVFIFDAVYSTEVQTGKISLVVAASAFAVAGLLLPEMKPLGFHIDYMALCLPVTCIAVILAVFRYDLLETTATARSKVFDASRDAILLISRKNRILDYNSSAKRLFEQAGIRLDTADLSALFEENENILEGLQKTQPYIVKLKVNGAVRYYDIVSEEISHHNTPRGWIKTIRDVTEIYQLNEELKRQVMTDELSVLSNRRAFIKIGKEWVAKSEESGRALHLLMLDLDHFKNVNDRFGHAMGDLVIRDFSRILKSHFPSESMVARLGGEEFAVLLAGFNDEELLQTVGSLQKKASRYVYHYFGSRFHVTASIGMTKRLPGQTLESMMRKADTALYQSKDRGRNRLTVL